MLPLHGFQVASRGMAPELMRKFLFYLSMTLTLAGTASGTPDPARGLLTNASLKSVTAIVERGANSRVMQRVSSETNETGRVALHTNRVVELGSGMHFKRGDEWITSDPTIQVSQDETSAYSTNGLHQVFFAANLNSAAPIRLVTSDNKVLRSRVVGLGYYDYKKQQSVLIAEVKDSVATVVGDNEVVYANAFTDFKADVRYTNTREGLEQDVILREQPPSPEKFGFNPKNTWLEVWTEFIDPPQPKKQEVIRKRWLESKVDKVLDFGQMRIGEGAAFGMGDNSDKYKGVPVQKHWGTIEGRTYLIEEISFHLGLKKMRNLPKAQHAALRQNGNAMVGRVSDKRLLPERKEAKVKTNEKIHIASLGPKTPGFVLDYSILNVDTNDFTFQGDQTYYISGPLNFSGATVIEGGAVIKYTNGATISILGSIECKTDSYRPAILTAYNDNSVGDIISTNALSPSDRCAAAALDLSSGGDLHNLHIRYADKAIFSSTNITVSNSQFIHCNTALHINLGSCWAKNVLIYDVVIGFNGNDYQAVAEHLTFDQGLLMDDWFYGLGGYHHAGLSDSTLCLTNSLITGVPTNSVVQLSYGDDTVFVESSDGIYQTVGAASHYLADGSPYRDVGTTNISSDLAAALTKKTTYPPIVLTNTVSADVTLSPQAGRDSGWVNSEQRNSRQTESFCLAQYCPRAILNQLGRLQ
jgi:hypothetical protein